jgi:hypothetical protein
VIVPEVDVLRKTEIVLEVALDTTTSSFPSPSRSPSAMDWGPVPVAKSTFVAKLLPLIDPLVAVFRSTESVFAVRFEMMRSGLPSPSISPTAALSGSVPVV